MLNSTVCRYEHLNEDWFSYWNSRLGSIPILPIDPTISQRKVWEWCAIAEALRSRGMLEAGRRGLGFAVGQEPLPSLFASCGASVLATDLAPEDSSGHWIDTGQHTTGTDALFKEYIVDRPTFDRSVAFQAADMNNMSNLPAGAFDFIWSSCALEHLGTMDDSLRFVVEAMDLLKPGGIAVHTTEFNVSSNTETVMGGSEVIFRRSDIEGLDCMLRHRESGLGRVDYFAGDHPYDLACDNPPYFQSGRMHLKLRMHGFVATSILLVCTKG